MFAEVSRLIRGNVAVPTKSVTVLPISDFSSGLRKIK